MLTSLFAERLHPLTWRFLLFVEAKRRMGILRGIGVALRELRDHEAGIRRAHVTSALPLSAAESELLAQRIARKTGSAIEMTAAVTPGLLGGFCVRIGDQLYDLSLAGALRTVKQNMIRG